MGLSPESERLKEQGLASSDGSLVVELSMRFLLALRSHSFSQISPLLSPGSVTWGQLLDIYEPQFSHW